jgi:asparagine synthase (glutamine-hydrolysing)
VSDIFLSAGVAVETTQIEAHLRWVPNSACWSGSQDGLAWVVSRVDDPILWAPAFDPVSRVRVLLGGRLALEESDWERASRLPYEGGLAARHVLQAWLKQGQKGLEALNGGALAVMIDEGKREVFVQTDRMGFYPAFQRRGPGLLLCSHPDVAAAALERAGYPCDFDAVTMAEFLRTGTATQPHTYWRQISQLDPGAHYRGAYAGGGNGLAKVKDYWRPAYFEGRYITDRREIVARLAEALSRSVRLRTHSRLGKVAVLLSSGADSRTALFGAQRPSEVVAFTMYDEPNEELYGARRLAAAAGAVHIGFQRSQDYYIAHAAEAVRISGGMWSVDSAHYGGLLPEINAAQAGVVLTGCYADYLLKGLAYNRRHRMLAGRALPLYRLAPFADEFYQPYAEITGDWRERVEQRLNSRFASVAAERCQVASAAEYFRLAPIIREADASGRLFLRRTSPIDLFMSDNDVLDLAGLICPSEKINGIPFGMAVDRICGKEARRIPNNNYGTPVGASEIQRVSSFLKASLWRKISGKGSGQPYDRNPKSVATVASWPYLPRVIELSVQLRQWRTDLPKDQDELLFEMIGAERRSWTIEDWARRAPTLFMRLFTASLWLSQNTRALVGKATA